MVLRMHSTTASSAITWVNQNVVLWIGAQDTGSGATRFFSGGYMDEIRLSNVARYTANFTPDTTEFSSDANTKLLIHSNTTIGSTTFTDSSGSAHTISALGACMHVAPKFGLGMASFDGSGDYITMPKETLWLDSGRHATTSDWTIEGWWYFTTDTAAIFVEQGTNTDNALQIWWDNSDNIWVGMDDNGSSWSFSVTSNSTLAVKTWYHIALVRNEYDIRLYINGTLDSAFAATVFNGDMNHSDSLVHIGESRTGSDDMNGYVDEFRVSTVARYTANFTPSTTAFTNDKDTRILLHMDGGGGIDAATNLPTLPGQGTYFWDAATNGIFYDSEGVPTSKSAIRFPGTDDYLVVSDSSDWQFGTNDFTWETWVNFSAHNNAGGDSETLIKFGDYSSASPPGWQSYIYYYPDQDSIEWSLYNMAAGDASIRGSSVNWSLDKWIHIAAERKGTAFRLYRDGVSIGSSVSASAVNPAIGNSGYMLELGGHNLLQHHLNGYMDQIRISNTARYSDGAATTFTPSETISGIDMLMVGGGGGAGGGNTSPGGGGGAGGFQTATSLTAVAQDYNIVVGNGGKGGDPADFGTNGGNTYVSGWNYTSLGGGAGAKDNQPGVAGGSGGGGSLVNRPGGAGNQSPGSGNAGGAGAMTGSNTMQAAGGGGGAGGAGGDASTSNGGTGGNGGAGLTNDYQTGSNQTYAGGGGGGGGGNAGGGPGGSGGSGIGGDGAYNTIPGKGAANTGSGGGGGTYGPVSGSEINGAAGSDGIVIIRYQSSTAKATGGTITTYGAGGSQYYVHTFTAPSFTPPTEPFTVDANTKLLVQSDFSEGGLGADHSGNYNYFTPANLTASDMMEDSPMNNFCTWNPIAYYPGITTGTLAGNTYSEGNLKVASTVSSGANWTPAIGTLSVSSGKWYWEYNCISNTGNSTAIVGVMNAFTTVYANPPTTTGYRASNGNKYIDWVVTSYGATLAAGDIIGCALDLDAETITFYKNNVSQGAISLGAQTKASGSLTPTIAMGDTSVWTANFGQDSSFAGAETAQGNQDANNKGDFYYAPPTGHLALCTDNLSDPSISGVDAPKNFDTVTYAGTGASQSIAVGFQPDLVWAKSRNAAVNNVLYDSARGTGRLESNNTSAEGTRDGFVGFTSTGFDVDSDGGGGNINYPSGRIYVAWNWAAGGTPTVDNSAGVGNVPTAGSVKINGANMTTSLAGSSAVTRLSANTTNGFSIAEIEIVSGNLTFAHGLSQAPEFVIFKSITPTGDWYCQHQATGNAVRIMLNSTATYTSSTSWNTTSPTASVVSANINHDNPSIAYCFHGVEGYSKFGSYIGNGTNNDGPFAYCGFKPAYILIRDTTTAEDWLIYDNKRDPYNVSDTTLEANDSAAENANGAFELDMLSNGFKIRESSADGRTNRNNDVYIFAAFAESPFKTSNAR